MRLLSHPSALWIDSFSLKRYGSTHPRRAAFFYHHRSYFSGLRKISIHSHDTEQRDIDDGFYEDREAVPGLENTHLVFIGDSHVEFFSRIKAKAGHYFQNTTAIWLGPKTLMGYAHQSDLDQDAKRIARLLKPVITKAQRDNKRVEIIWCMGTIDIRFSIYELLLRQVMPTEKDILDLFENAAEKIMTSHIPKIVQYLDLGSFKLGYAGCTNILQKGQMPQTVKEVKTIRQTEKFPTFGSSDQRDSWMIDANTRIKALCKTHNFKFFDIVLTNVEHDRDQFSKDGIHLTDPSQLNKAASSYLNACESRNG